MNLACCVLGLALFGADERNPAKAAGQEAPASPNSEASCVRREREPEKELWRLTRGDAIRIGLDNSETVRVILEGKAAKPVGNCFGPAGEAVLPPRAMPIDLPKGMRIDCSAVAISQVNADTTIHRFKAEVMVQIRSIEKQYWKLAEAHTAVWAAEQAVNLAQDVVELEQSDLVLSRGCSVVAITEACGRLEQFQKVLAGRQSDAAKAERQLRELLGLPESDNRQIIAVDQPIKEHVVFDWDASLEAMMQNGPDIAGQEAVIGRAEKKLNEARNATPEKAKKPEAQEDSDVKGTWVGFTTGSRRALANTRQCQYTLLRAKEFQVQVVQQSTQSLKRAIGEVDSGFGRFTKAKHLRIAALMRLKAQRAYYDEGRITADRYLDAVEQYATLVANEHHHLAAYNSALTFVSECKGTLLEDRDIIVAERSRVGAVKGLGDDIPDNVFAKRADQ